MILFRAIVLVILIISSGSTTYPALSQGLQCDGREATIVGTEGNDVLEGTPGNDVIVGLGGDDTITGGDGDDVICGGDGNDTIKGGAGNDIIFGGSGSDRLDGDDGDDLLIGGAGQDALDGGRGNNTCDIEEDRREGNDCQTVIGRPDTRLPVVTVPSNITIQSTGGSMPVEFTVTASDDVDGNITPTCDPSSGFSFPIGVTTVTCTATDAAGNTSSESFTVTVIEPDTRSPVVTVPSNITIETTGESMPVEFTVTASDDVDGNITPTCDPSSGFSFPIGTTKVTCTATDSGGNTSSKSFKVTVIGPDITPPVITVPSNITAQTPGESMPVEFTVTASDVVDGNITPTCDPSSGFSFPTGVITTVTCTATDAAGNTSSESFTITVAYGDLPDTIPPVVLVPNDVTIQATSDNPSPVTFSVSASDDVDGNITPSCSHTAGSDFPIGATTVTCTATDSAGNTSSESFTITVAYGDLPDTIPPVVLVPNDVTIQTTSNNPSPVTFSVSASDVAGAITPACSPTSGSDFPIGATTVTCTATNAAGTSSESFTITVAYEEIILELELEPEAEPEPEPEPKELGLASFVDTSKDPQSYVDRYNNEESYKDWFDKNYPGYPSIYEAVGLEKPLEVPEPEPEPKPEPEHKPEPEPVCGEGTELNSIGQCIRSETSTSPQESDGGCLIATAAYGSELAPQVQQLRELRDNTVLTTESGAAFMESFNSLYYSFSPAIADLERQNPAFKETVKLAITPLVSSLAILNYLDIDSEEKMLGYGIGIILLNIGMYFAAPAFVIYRLRK